MAMTNLCRCVRCERVVHKLNVMPLLGRPYCPPCFGNDYNIMQMVKAVRAVQPLHR